MPPSQANSNDGFPQDSLLISPDFGARERASRARASGIVHALRFLLPAVSGPERMLYPVAHPAHTNPRPVSQSITRHELILALPDATAMLTLHHLNNSRSQRILWLLEALETPYEIKRYQRDPKTMLAPPELKAVHPLGKSPILTDGDLTLAESGLIIEYLIDRYGDGRFAPAVGTAAQLDFRYWLHYAEGSLMPLILLKLVFRRVAHTPAPFFMRPVLRKVSASAQDGFVDPQLALHLGYLNTHLGKTGWFVGDTVTGADMQMSFPIEAAEARAGLGKYPALAAFLSRIRAEPAYQRALEKGGPFKLS